MDDELQRTLPPPPTLALELSRLAPGRSVFAGDLSALTPPDLLNFLHAGQRTGVLIAQFLDSQRAVALLDGKVAWCASTEAAERFGERVCRMGMLDRPRIAEVLAAQPNDLPRRKLGEILVAQGLLTEEQRAAALHDQAVQIFTGLLSLSAGRFDFRAGLDPEQLPTRLELSIETLLLDGLRRLDELAWFRDKLPDATRIPRRPALSPPASEDHGPEAERLLAAADGALALEQLFEKTGLGELETLRAASKLIDAGELELVPKA